MYSFFNLSARWSVINATPRPLYPRERNGSHCIGGWVGPSAGLDGCGKSRPPPGFDPRTVQPVASRYTDWAIRAHTKLICDFIQFYVNFVISHTESQIRRLICRLHLKCDGTRAETRFRLSAKRTSPFKSEGWGGGVSSVDYWQSRCAHQR